MLYRFKSHFPKVHSSSFVHPLASVTGNVSIGKNVFVGSGAVLRGDIGKVIVEDGCNVQENCILHTFPGQTVRLKKGAHIGHGAIVHGANVGRNVLIGMGAVIMDHAEIGDNSIIGALSLITEGTKIPVRKVVVGNPAKIVKDVSAKMLKWKTQGTAIYRQLTRDYLKGNGEGGMLKRKDKVDLKKYKTWKRTRKA